jgi:hypothetical protein
MVCYKYKAAADAASGVWNSFPDLRPSVPQYELAKLNYLTQEVMQVFIADEALEEISLDQCVEYRKAAAGTLERLRSYLYQLSAEIDSRPWEKSLEHDVKKIIATKVIPEADRIRDTLANIRFKMFGGIAAGAASVALPSLMVTIFPVLSAPLILLFGSSAVTGGYKAKSAKPDSRTSALPF